MLWVQKLLLLEWIGVSVLTVSRLSHAYAKEALAWNAPCSDEYEQLQSGWAIIKYYNPSLVTLNPNPYIKGRHAWKWGEPTVSGWNTSLLLLSRRCAEECYASWRHGRRFSRQRQALLRCQCRHNIWLSHSRRFSQRQALSPCQCRHSIWLSAQQALQPAASSEPMPMPTQHLAFAQQALQPAASAAPLPMHFTTD